MTNRWIGIDEAGYGPNLGPLVMVAVVAETGDGRRPEVWADLPGSVGRAGSGGDRLWVDDSKAILRGGKGRDRLEAAAIATLGAAGHEPPGRFSEWLGIVGAGPFDRVELSPWLGPGEDPVVLRDGAALLGSGRLPGRPFDGAAWKIVAVRAEVVGPGRFNAGIEAGGSKADAHFAAFARLLRPDLGRVGRGGDVGPLRTSTAVAITTTPPCPGRSPRPGSIAPRKAPT